MADQDRQCIARLGLSTRCGNVLRRNQISTIDQLRRSAQVLPLLEGAGAAVVAEVLGALVLFDERGGQGNAP